MMLVIGIDPDTSKSGLAVYNIEKKDIRVSSLTFFQIFDFLKKEAHNIELVRIEAGWLNQKSNFHGKFHQTKAEGERIAKNVGSNHETGRKLVEMCHYLNLSWEIVRPLGTKKIDDKTFKMITKVKGRTNQDMRDAGMLVWNWRKVKVKSFDKKG